MNDDAEYLIVYGVLDQKTYDEDLNAVKKSILMTEEFPSKLIRKFQLILYSKTIPSVPSEDIVITVHDQVFILLPQTEHVLKAQFSME